MEEKHWSLDLKDMSQDAQAMIKSGQDKLKTKDKKLRAADRHFASASPLVRPLEPMKIRDIEILLQNFMKAKKQRLGSFKSLQDVLKQFMLLEPLEDEAEQPLLGIGIVAMSTYFACIDNLYTIGGFENRVTDLKDRISELLQVEWIRRKGLMTAHLDIYESAFEEWGTKEFMPLSRRLKNVSLAIERLSASRGVEVAEGLTGKVNATEIPEASFDKTALALISLLADPDRWKDQKTFLKITGDKHNCLELSPDALDGSEAIDMSDAMTKRLHAMARTLRFREAAALPMVAPPHDWRNLEVPDCQNGSGGYDEEALRVVNNLGHGHHRSYTSQASQQALDAVNKAQRVRFKLDTDMADFIKQCVEASDGIGEDFPDLASKPKFTRDDIQKGINGAAILPEVINRERGLKLIPDDAERKSEKGLARIRSELGFDWNENNRILTEAYTSVEEHQKHYQRTISILSRINELEKPRYRDGFYWCFGLDHRGRIYEKSDFFSPQKSAPERYSLCFANGEELTDANLDQIFIAIGGAYKGTKISLAARRKIGKENLEWFKQIGRDLYRHRHEIFNPEVDEPWMFAQLCANLARCADFKDPWTTPIYIDATCSGIQWWSSITNDEDVQRLCNLAPATEDDEPYDAYLAVQESVEALLKEEADPDALFIYMEKRKQKRCSPEEKEMIMEAIGLRKALKNALMTRGYGSTLPTRIDDLHALLIKNFNNHRLPRHIAIIAAKIINKAMTKRYGPIFEAELFVKQVARAAIQLQLEKVEYPEFRYDPTVKNELTLEELRTRKRKIQDYADALEAGNTVEAERLAAELRTEEQEKTTEKFQKRIADKVPSFWRKDRLARRSDYWFTKRVTAKNEHNSKHAYKANCNLTWTVPDGYKVGVVEPYRTQAQSIKAGVLPQIRLNMTVAETVDPHRLIRASAPSFIHSLDSCLLRRMINQLGCDAVVIHDSCGVLPSQVKNLKQTMAVEMGDMIGTDGRELLLGYLNQLIPQQVTNEDGSLIDCKVYQQLKKRFDKTFTKTQQTPLSETLPLAIYAWN